MVYADVEIHDRVTIIQMITDGDVGDDDGDVKEVLCAIEV